ncbi:hypothetical protein L218DRAFT_131825 [Marasmius fiardii PR-910]|nr:hypothetical protein L218DRAFT_131825 [Marasmius fiardii PR-910]
MWVAVTNKRSIFLLRLPLTFLSRSYFRSHVLTINHYFCTYTQLPDNHFHLHDPLWTSCARVVPRQLHKMEETSFFEFDDNDGLFLILPPYLPLNFYTITPALLSLLAFFLFLHPLLLCDILL